MRTRIVDIFMWFVEFCVGGFLYRVFGGIVIVILLGSCYDVYFSNEKVEV